MLVLLSVLGAAGAATLTVDPSSSSAYATISDAIDAASSGDTVAVVAGTYRECVVLGGLDLTVTGAGSGSTEIDPRGGCSFAVEASEGETLTLTGFTLTNAGQRGLYGDEATLVLDDVVFDGLGSGSAYGGAVYLDEGSFSGTNLTFSDNRAYAGAAIYALDEAVLDLADTTFSGNAAAYGAAIFLADDGGDVYLDLVDCSFLDNYASYIGGALFADDEAVVTSVRTVWEGNVAESSNGGAVYLSDETEYTGTDETFRDNLSGLRGGAFFAFSNAIARISSAAFESNSAQQGGHLAVSEADLTLSGVDFTDGFATGSGGAAYFLAGQTVLENANFVSNSAGSSGGAVYAESGGELTLSNLVFTDNTAGSSAGDAGFSYVDRVSIDTATSTGAVAASDYPYGGSMFFSGVAGDTALTALEVSDTAGYYGGALYIGNTGNVSLTGSAFRNNEAVLGGAIDYYNTAGTGRLTVGSTRFVNNTAENSGGALYAYNGGAGGPSLTVRYSVFRGNEAPYIGGALYSHNTNELVLVENVFEDNAVTETDVYYYGGGGAYLYQPNRFRGTNNRFCNNRSTGSGGGVYVYNAGAGGQDSWRNNLFQENVADLYGGGVYVSGSTAMEALNNAFLGNDALEDGGAVFFYLATLRFTNNLFAYTQDGDALFAYDAASAGGSSFSYNAFWENRRADGGGALSLDTSADGNFRADPGLRAYSVDGDCSNDDLRPGAGSPLIDAGDPSILDLDGSVSDVGIYGGPDSLLVDNDGDGYDIDDCDDDDPQTYPGADERCDGVDNDCDEEIDEDAVDAGTWYADADEDLYGDPDVATTACEQPDGTVPDDTDCDDTDALINPGAEDTPGNGIDEDCDGLDAEEVDEPGDGDGDGGSDGSDGTDGGASGRDQMEKQSTCGGCASHGGGGPASFLGLGVLAAGLVRRRQA